jgi:hypothetical protein
VFLFFGMPLPYLTPLSPPTLSLPSPLILPTPVSDSSWTRPKIAIVRASTPPKIDGDLNDICWQGVAPVRGFYRFASGAPVKEQTEAWIAQDNEYLYIAFHCLDSAPEKIIANESQRGGNLERDDHVTVTLDSQNLRRNGSFFLVSPRGTQSEFLEGGTAGNITWAGDWKAVTKRVADGWCAEIAIPFKLLRYQPGTKNFGVILERYLGRESNSTTFPYIPLQGQSNFSRNQFVADLTGITPAKITPKPTILPYSLSTFGSSPRAREGVDIKYPLSTTLTGLVALFPDFQTIEQDVANVSFSYNEQFVEDRRAFFAEGKDFLPQRDLLYTRRLTYVDEGVKIAGKDGPNTIGVIATTAKAQGTSPARSSVVANYARDFGSFNRLGFSLAADNKSGTPDNQVGSLYGTYVWQNNSVRVLTEGRRHASFSDGKTTGNLGDLSVRISGQGPGKPRLRLSTNTVQSNFTSNLGFVPEKNRRGKTVNLSQRNRFDKGFLEDYDWEVESNQYARATGGFFHRDTNMQAVAKTRKGFGVSLGMGTGARQPDSADPTTYHDWRLSPGILWNQRTLFSRGSLNIGRGKQAGLPTRTFSLQQGIPIRKSFSLQASIFEQKRGTDKTNQTLLTGTYRLNPLESIAGRFLAQSGSGNAQTVGAGTSNNFYLAYSRRSRKGTDIFVLLGDPNSQKIKTQISIKVTKPY